LDLFSASADHLDLIGSVDVQHASHRRVKLDDDAGLTVTFREHAYHDPGVLIVAADFSHAATV
jgi:hypothetical protein